MLPAPSLQQHKRVPRASLCLNATQQALCDGPAQRRHAGRAQGTGKAKGMEGCRRVACHGHTRGDAEHRESKAPVAVLQAQQDCKQKIEHEREACDHLYTRVQSPHTRMSTFEHIESKRIAARRFIP